jgi:Family of unknown function (DUF6632)
VFAANRLLYLRVALIVFGLIFIFTLGVFLILASRNPDAYRNIIWFTIWSSVVHGGVMAAQSFSDAAERGHLLGDVPALFLVAIVLGALMPRAAQA